MKQNPQQGIRYFALGYFYHAVASDNFGQVHGGRWELSLNHPLGHVCALDLRIIRF